MTKEKTKADNNSSVVTEEDLLKSIKALETKVDEPEPDVVEPKVEVETLGKTAAETIKEGASDKLKKALDVSEALTEITGLLGSHVEAGIEALAKSVQGSAERDLAFTRVLLDMKKSIDDLGEKITSFGEAPSTPVSKQAPAATETELLVKTSGVSGGNKKDLDPRVFRKQISGGLEQLAKKADKGSPEATKYINAAVKYESTGVIEDLMLAEVRDLYKAA